MIQARVDDITALGDSGRCGVNEFTPSSSRQVLQQQQELLDQNVPIELPEIPLLSTAFLYSEAADGNINKKLMLLYDPVKISFSTCFSTMVADIEPRASLKQTVHAALGHIAYIIYIFRYRRAIRIDANTRKRIVVKLEMDIHKTSHVELQYVEDVCRYYMRNCVNPTLKILFWCCLRYKKKDFLSGDGTFIMLQSTTLQILIEISRCIERLTNESFSSLLFPINASEEDINCKKQKLSALHRELEFIQTPTTFCDDI